MAISPKAVGIAGVVGLLGLAALASMGSEANAATPPAPPRPPPAPIPPLEETPTSERPPAGWNPPSQALQARPLLPSMLMSGPQRWTVIAVAQRQLNQLGYGPLTVDGIVGQHTSRAATDFANSSRAAVNAYMNVGLDADRAVFTAIDDKYRENTGTPRANDYRSAGLGGGR